MSEVAWEHWQQMKGVQLWKCICLSCNIEPDQSLLKMAIHKEHIKGVHQITHNYPISFNNSQLQRRYQVASSYFDTDSCFKIIDRPKKFSPLEWNVDIRSFYEWAMLNEIPIPKQFPQDKKRTSQPLGQISLPNEFNASVMNSEGGVTLKIPYMTEELRRVLLAMEVAYANKITDSGSLKTCLENAFDGIGYKIPDVTVEQLAIVIRPDEIAFNDPRSRKKPMRP